MISDCAIVWKVGNSVGLDDGEEDGATVGPLDGCEDSVGEPDDSDVGGELGSIRKEGDPVGVDDDTSVGNIVTPLDG